MLSRATLRKNALPPKWSSTLRWSQHGRFRRSEGPSNTGDRIVFSGGRGGHIKHVSVARTVRCDTQDFSIVTEFDIGVVTVICKADRHSTISRPNDRSRLQTVTGMFQEQPCSLHRVVTWDGKLAHTGAFHKVPPESSELRQGKFCLS